MTATPTKRIDERLPTKPATEQRVIRVRVVTAFADLPSYIDVPAVSFEAAKKRLVDDFAAGISEWNG